MQRSIKSTKLKILEDKSIGERVIESLQDYQFRNKNILVVCEDNTRSSPVHKIFPLLRRIVENEGAQSIEILFALGTHRPMTEEETLMTLRDTHEHENVAHVYEPHPHFHQ